MTRIAVASGVVAVLLLAAVVRAEEAVEPVDHTKLLPFLPEKVTGFAAEKAQGSTSSAMGFQLTQVSRVYHQRAEDGDGTVTVKITDGAGNHFFTAAHTAVAAFNTANADGYEKGLKLDGFPAIERYTTASRDGSLTVFIANRFLVEIDIDGLDSKTMQVWWQKLDAKKLEALKE